MAIFPGFVGGAYAGTNPVSANETLVNWYPSRVETPGATFEWELLPTQGLVTLDSADLGYMGMAAWSGGGRQFVIYGLFSFDSRLYEVVGSALTLRATLAGPPATGPPQPATISSTPDGLFLLITCGGNAYSYDLTTDTATLEITGGVLQGGVVDGYGVVFQLVGSEYQIRISDLLDLTTWDPLQFALRSIQSDPWKAMHVDPYGYVHLFGEKTSEAWSNVGNFPFPFAPDRSSLIEEGIAAPFSVQQVGKHTAWLASNGSGGYQVMALQGSMPRRISTHAIERQISGYHNIDGSDATSYESDGHAFYLLTFSVQNTTWGYDFATDQWHRRAGGADPDARTEWDARFICFEQALAADSGRYLAVSRTTNALYQLSTVNTGSEVRERTTPAVTNENQRLFFDRLELLCQSGVPGDPNLYLEVSNDYGRTFGTPRPASIGTPGETTKRCVWWGLGSGQGRVYRVRAYGEGPWRITAAFQKVRGAAPLEAA